MDLPRYGLLEEIRFDPHGAFVVLRTVPITGLDDDDPPHEGVEIQLAPQTDMTLMEPGLWYRLMPGANPEEEGYMVWSESGEINSEPIRLEEVSELEWHQLFGCFTEFHHDL